MVVAYVHPSRFDRIIFRARVFDRRLISTWACPPRWKTSHRDDTPSLLYTVASANARKPLAMCVNNSGGHCQVYALRALTARPHDIGARVKPDSSYRNGAGEQSAFVGPRKNYATRPAPGLVRVDKEAANASTCVIGPGSHRRIGSTSQTSSFFAFVQFTQTLGLYQHIRKQLFPDKFLSFNMSDSTTPCHSLSI